MTERVQEPPAGGQRGLFALVALIGVPAAALLLEMVPLEESGRKVEVIVAPDQRSVSIRHVAGRQYLKTYLDLAGVPTACDGLTEGIRRGQTFTEAQCEVLLEAALVKHAAGALRCSSGLRALRDAGRGYAVAAVVSLTYNIGIGGFCGSTVRKRIDAGDVSGGCRAMLAWNKARVRGKLVPVPGLTARREREAALCRKELS